MGLDRTPPGTTKKTKAAPAPPPRTGETNDLINLSPNNSSTQLTPSTSRLSTTRKDPSTLPGAVPLPGMVGKDKTPQSNQTYQTPTNNMDNSTSTSGLMGAQVRKFDGKNFGVWKEQILALLTIRGLAMAVIYDKPVLTNDIDKNAKQALINQWIEKQPLARAILLLSLDDNQAVLVSHLRTARDIWVRLEMAYESTNAANKVTLQRQFFDCQMRDGEKVVDFCSRVQRIYTQMKSCGVTIEEDSLVGRIIAGLTPAYHAFMSGYANGHYGNQTMGNILPRLTAEEQLISKNKKTNSMAMVGDGFKGKAGKKFQGKNQKKPDAKQQSANTSESKSKKDRSQMTCYNCQQKGHFASKCQNPRAPKPDKTDNVKSEGAVAHGCVAEADTANISPRYRNNWIMDSAATEHMTFDDSNFEDRHDLVDHKPVRGFDGSVAYATAIGNLRVIADIRGKERMVILHDVLYVPTMQRKLFSIGAAASRGCQATIGNNLVQVLDCQGRLLIEAKKIDNLYVAMVTECSTCAQANAVTRQMSKRDDVDNDDDSNLKLWHERLAHVNQKTIVKMHKENSASGLENLNINIDAKASDRKQINCEACYLGKQSRLHFPSSQRERSQEVGHRIHVDICGPIGTETLVKSKYIVLFKDEHSNYRHIFFARTKDESFDFTQKCITQIESDTKKKVFCLVSDCGSEFTSNKMKKYLQDKGVAQEFSAPFTPQQNGFIERDNRTIMEATRTILFHAKLAEKLWGEAANTVVYLMNRVINRNTKDKTPYELYFGQKPRLNHVRIFGSLAMVKQQEKKRSGYQKKLEARAIKLILVGYQRDFTYRLYNPDNDNIILSRDVIFDESKFIGNGISGSYEAIDELIESDVDHSNEVEGDLCQVYANAADTSLNDEPKTYQEAINCSESNKWVAAMRDGYNSLIKNETWRIERAPSGRMPIKCKWVFKLKKNPDGTVSKYKARLVAKGFSQREGIDYQETFAPVVRMESIRTILSVAAKEDLDIIQFDVKTAFLHGELKEEIWMNQPEGFEQGDGLSCRLTKSLYGLKQASRAWNECFLGFLKQFDLEPMKSDSCVLTRTKGSDILIIAIYVDDGLACSNNKLLLSEVVNHLKKRFEITVMEAECFVGLMIKRDRKQHRIEINQKTYIEGVLERFDLADCKTVSTPVVVGAKFVKTGIADGPTSKTVDVPYREAIGSLMYAMVGTRPDIACVVNILARFAESPKLPHWEGVKRVMRYLKETASLSLVYQGKGSTDLVAYCDADFAACRDSRKSVTGIVVKHSSAPIIWKSTKQSTVAESTTEAEFIACSTASREIVWARNFLGEIYRKKVEAPTTIYCDNQSAIQLVRNNQIHSRIKHIDIRLFAVREREENRLIKVKYINTTDQQADLLTKPIMSLQFIKLRSLLGMALVLCLVSIMNTQAMVRLKFQRPVKELGISRIALKITNPCAQINEIEESNIKRRDVSLGARTNISAIQASRHYCDNVFINVIQPEIRQLDSCLGGRNKRDLATILAATSATAQVVVGVTNLIKGLSEPATMKDKDNVISGLTTQLSSETKAIITDPDLKIDEEQKELQIVSQQAAWHIDESKTESESFPLLWWQISHVMHELHAGSANIRAMLNYCKKKQLATKEIGELMESDELFELDPSSTTLKSIHVDNNATEIIIQYNQEAIMELSYIVIIGTIVSLTILMYLVYLLALSHKILLARQGGEVSVEDAATVSWD